MPPRKKPKAPTTLPLFDVYRSPESVQRFEPDRVRGATLRSRISRGISETLRQAQTSTGDVLNRAAVAVAMGEWLDTPVSKAVLDKYAAVSSEEHEITVSRMTSWKPATPPKACSSSFRTSNQKSMICSEGGNHEGMVDVIRACGSPTAGYARLATGYQQEGRV